MTIRKYFRLSYVFVLAAAALTLLKKDDLVIAYQGHPIDDAAALQSSVGDTPWAARSA